MKPKNFLILWWCNISTHQYRHQRFMFSNEILPSSLRLLLLQCYTDVFRSLWVVSGEFAVPSNGRCVIAGSRIALEVNCYLCTHLISPSSNDQRHKHSAISNPCSIFNHKFLAVYQHTPECVKRILTFWYPNYFGS